ncbi:MAG: hypothetical protein QME40_05265 [bacterium]|nr:hypothetical protein [bacterium]
MKVKIIIILGLLIGVENLWAFEKRIYPNISIQRDFLKGPDFKEKVDIIKLEVDMELFFTKNSKLTIYPIQEYNLSSKKGEFKFRKAYIGFLIKEVYCGIGKQPIIWGVGRGRNPTNYIKEIQPLEKQMEQDVSQEGIDSFMLTFPIKGFTVENIVPFSNSSSFAMRAKTFLWDTDFSLSFYKYKDRLKVGGDFERGIGDLFGLYMESSFKDTKNYEGLIGISRSLSSVHKSDIDLEYFISQSGDKKEDYVFTQVTFSPREDISLFNLLLFDLDKRITFFMPKLSYYLERMEFAVISTFKIKDNKEYVDYFPFDYIITTKITYYF